LTSNVQLRGKKVGSTPEEERAAARGFELCSRILREHGFGDTATLYDEAQVLCAVKALVLEDIERRAEDFRKAIAQTANARWD
jgi:hypothetical protein